LVRLAGFEPTTPWFVAKYSIQLSYSRCEEARLCPKEPCYARAANHFLQKSLSNNFQAVLSHQIAKFNFLPVKFFIAVTKLILQHKANLIHALQCGGTVQK
jgi:hypothetical protein